MKGPWKVFSQMIGDTRKYIAGRQIDTSKVLHAGNIEYHGEYGDDKDSVEIICAMLNSITGCNGGVV